MKIIAHRGASHIAPENTMAAFQTAWEENADGIELDIRMTADHQFVAFHDKTARRTTGHRISIDQSTYADLSDLDAGSWKDQRWSGEPIPLLTDVLDRLPADKTIIIEIKSGLDTVPHFVKLIQSYAPIHEHIIIISFHYDVVTAVKKEVPHLSVLWIVEFGYNVPAFSDQTRQQVITQIERGKLDGISSEANLKHCTALAPDIQHHNWCWNVWTVDDHAQARDFHKLGVQLLTTNRPGAIRKSLSNVSNDD